jgi:hypothetical protein
MYLRTKRERKEKKVDQKKKKRVIFFTEASFFSSAAMTRGMRPHILSALLANADIGTRAATSNANDVCAM